MKGKGWVPADFGEWVSHGGNLATDIAIIQDHLLQFSEVRLSYPKALQVMHQARQFVTMRNALVIDCDR